MRTHEPVVIKPAFREFVNQVVSGPLKDVNQLIDLQTMSLDYYQAVERDFGLHPGIVFLVETYIELQKTPDDLRKAQTHILKQLANVSDDLDTYWLFWVLMHDIVDKFCRAFTSHNCPLLLITHEPTFPRGNRILYTLRQMTQQTALEDCNLIISQMQKVDRHVTLTAINSTMETMFEKHVLLQVFRT